MDAIAFTTAPSPPSSQTGANSLPSRTDDENSFAPTLSQAVSDRKNSIGSHSKKSLTPAVTHHQGKSSTKRSAPQADSSDTAKTSSPDKHHQPISSSGEQTAHEDSKASSTDNNGSKPAAEKPSNTDSKVTRSDIPGLLAYLFSFQRSLSTSDLAKEAAMLSDRLGIGRQKSLELLKDIAALNTNDLSASETGNALATDSRQEAALQKFLTALASLTSDAQHPGSFSANGNPEVPGSGLSGMGNPALAGNDTLLARQLQKIIAIVGGDKASLTRPQSDPQNQAAGLDSLSSPLLAIADQQAPQKGVAPSSLSPFGKPEDRQGQQKDAAASAGDILPASPAKDMLPAGNTTGNRSAKTDNIQNHPFWMKGIDQGQKDPAKDQGKDAGMQNTGDHQQTGTLPSIPGSSDTAFAQMPGQMTFGNTLTQTLQPGQTSPAPSTATHAFSWTTAQETSLVNQVTQRFQFTPSSPNSKIVLKLYPEELGELKIDIQMMDGAIKATIATQSQQVQQVLEKYIPKLRTVMEQQGLTVDDIAITNSSDNVGGHGLFQEDFVGNNDFSPPGNSAQSTPSFDLSLERTFPENSGAVSSVNVTV